MISIELRIKNMVCNRCIKVIKEELKAIDLNINHIELGLVILEQIPNPTQTEQIKQKLIENGFELLDDKQQQIIEKIKLLIIQQIHHSKNQKPLSVNYSEYLSNTLALDYAYLSNLFSSVEQTTIEKFIILQKIEKVKEFLVYDELTLSEIAWQMGYSSVAYLSNQFKKITGLSPSNFKQLKKHHRNSIDLLS